MCLARHVSKHTKHTSRKYIHKGKIIYKLIFPDYIFTNSSLNPFELKLRGRNILIP